MLVSEDAEFIERARFLATQARDPAPHYQHSEIGYNYRMSNVLAAIGRGQLKVLEDRVAARRGNFEHYHRELAVLPGVNGKGGHAATGAVIGVVNLLLTHGIASSAYGGKSVKAGRAKLPADWLRGAMAL